MLTKEDLLSISQLIDGKLEPFYQLIDDRFEQVDRRFEQIDQRFEQVERRFEQVDQRFHALEDRLQTLEGQVHKIQLCIENNIKPELQNISACYTSTYDRYKTEAVHIAEMRTDIGILKDVAQEHSRKLAKESD